MLTYSQRKQYRCFIYLKTFLDSGYFENYSNGVEKHLNVIELFYGRIGIQPRVAHEIKRTMVKIENKFDDAGIIGKTTDSIMCLSICISCAEMITEKINDSPTCKIWNDLSWYCRDQLVKNYYEYSDSLEIAEMIAEILMKTEN